MRTANLINKLTQLTRDGYTVIFRDNEPENYHRGLRVMLTRDGVKYVCRFIPQTDLDESIDGGSIIIANTLDEMYRNLNKQMEVNDDGCK